MIEIIRGEEWPLTFYPENNENVKYKLSDYIIMEKCDDGYLLLHTLSWSLFLLNEKEYENILNYDYLKKYKLVLNEDIDEHSLAKKIYLNRSSLPFIPTYDNVKTFIIYTTSKCNAQCFYCYQKDSLNQKHMSSKTADDVANFIINKAKGEIHIQWFGGEPLLNTNVMNQICEKLNENNVIFSSSMISNALLFDEKTINYAKTLWNFNWLQISMDGIGTVYNDIKNYKNKNINGFETVVNNIKNIMLLSNISVKIRFNVSNNNINNVKESVKYFHDNFNEYLMNGRIVLYTALLYDIYKTDINTSIKLLDDIENLSNKYIFLQKPPYYKILSHKNLLTCMADGGSTLSINPEGYFCVCNHWADKNIIGDIYNGITNLDELKSWVTKDSKNIEFCMENKCKYLPICVHHYKCDASPMCSINNEKNLKITQLKKSILYTYEEYKKRINQMKNGEE